MNPNILFFRYDKYSEIDDFFTRHKDELSCKVNIISKSHNLNHLFCVDYHILVTYGENETEYYASVNSVITPKMRMRWIHLNKLDDVNSFNNSVIFCYMNSITIIHCEELRPGFSIFTTCYNSYHKICRAYNSIINQRFNNWEWVILDDSPEDAHFTFLNTILKTDKRIRLYKRSGNSGSIGNVKNEAVSLCRGKYVLELDHDDEILPDMLLDAYNAFQENPEVGFIYSDFINIYENGNNFNYGDYFGLGYCGYYRQKYNNKWVYVVSTPNINNITLSHIVSIPNHPRIWKRETLLEIGNYSEYLPVADDYELLLRTAVKTKILKIHKLGYVQYMNDKGNNFSLLRNAEIQKLVFHLKNHCYKNYNIDTHMKTNDAYEEPFHWNKQIWKRENFEHKYCNKIVNVNYKRQYCIIGIETLLKHLTNISCLYEIVENDFLLLVNTVNSQSDKLCNLLDELHLDRMKCYSMDDCSNEELVRYFHLSYKSCDEFYIIDSEYSF